MAVYGSNVCVVASRVRFRASVVRRGLIRSVGVPFEVQASVLAAHISGGEHQIRSELPLDFNIPLLRVGILVGGSDEKTPAGPGGCCRQRICEGSLDPVDCFQLGGTQIVPVEIAVKGQGARPYRLLENVLCGLTSARERIPIEPVAPTNDCFLTQLQRRADARPPIVLHGRRREKGFARHDHVVEVRILGKITGNRGVVTSWRSCGRVKRRPIRNTRRLWGYATQRRHGCGPDDPLLAE